MKTNNNYMTRALQARDPRYATVLGKLGYTAPADSLPEVSMDRTKAELLEIGEAEGAEVSESMTKAEIITAIEAIRA